MIFPALGWIATALYIFAQGYLSFFSNWRRSVFYGANIVAALFLTISSAALQSWQAVVLNLFWMAVSGLAFVGAKLLETLPASVKWPLTGSVVLCVVGVAAWPFSADLSANIMGWGGTLLYCGAYLGFAAGRVTRRRYLILNAIAASLLLPVYTLDENWPSFLLNLVWIGVSLAGWWHIHRLRRSDMA